jgi:hypothetical protein
MLNLIQKTILASILLTLPLQADELRIHVIRPRIPISWSSPRALSVSSALNSAGHDYAPIGHFAIEVHCSRPNRYGVANVLTGMERKDKAESRRITLREGLGLASLTYTFRGQLQDARQAADEIVQAHRDRRLKTIRFPTTPDRCDRMLEFLDRWIEAGSEAVYGGGKDTLHGEGAGCADFAMVFFSIATGEAPPPEWLAQVSVPRSLMGGNGRKIPFTRLLTRKEWARSGEPSLAFQIADTDRVQEWMERERQSSAELTWPEGPQGPETELPAFRFRYPLAREPGLIWTLIRRPL